MRYLKKILYITLMCFVALVSLGAFLFTSPPGLYTTIKLANLFIPGKIHLHQANGRLINHFSFSKLSYDEGELHIQLSNGTMHWRLTDLFHHQLPVSLVADQLIVHINGPEHHIIAPPFNLQLKKVAIKQVQINHFGKVTQFNNVELQGTLHKHQWVIQSLHTSIANLDIDLSANGESTSPYSTTANLQLTKAFGLQINLKLQGDLALYRWQGQFSGLARGNISGTLKDGLTLHTKANWSEILWPLNSSKTLKINPGNLTMDGTLVDYILKSNLQIDAPVYTQCQLSAHVKNNQTEVNSTIYLPQGNLKTIITAKGTIYDSQNAKFQFTLHPGTYQFPADSPIPSLPFKGGDLFVNLSPHTLKANGLLSIDPSKTINVGLNLPNFQLQNLSTSQQNFDGKINLKIKSPDFLQGLSKAGETLSGQLELNLTTKGTMANPLFNGELFFTDASLNIPKSGQKFSPIQFKLQSRNNHWQTQGVINSNGHALTLQGQGDFFPQLSGKLTLVGENFPIIKNVNYAVDVSPLLVLQIHPKSIDLTGDILIPTAQLKPVSFSNTMNMSEDVVFVSKDKTTEANPFNLTANVLIKMGQNVNLDVKGLQGFLDGSLRIEQSLHSAPRAIGELTIRDGKYKAYGQDLVVDQGQLLFNGNLTDSPILHIRAIRKFHDNNSNFASTDQLLDFSANNIDTIDIGGQTTVGIELTGRLNAHKIKLFSIPSNLSQSDILSLLILGKPANQASKSGGQLLLAAISSMNLDSGTKGLQLLSQLKQTLGIDFNLQNSSPYTQAHAQGADNTTLAVGKSLSKRIYVSYNINVLQNDSNVLTLKYLLNKFFSLQITTSDSGNGLDLLYTHSKD